jgi:hypothetical protein
VAVVLAALVGADFALKTVAEHELAARAQSASGARRASAVISGFPFLWDLLVDGTVPAVALHLSDVPVGALHLHEVDVSLVGTHIVRSALFGQRQVRVSSIDSGTAAVTVTAADLSAALGQTVSLPGDGRAYVERSGVMVPATITVGSESLVLRVAGVPVLESDLSASRLVAACALSLHVGAGALTVSCTMAPVPYSVVQSLAGAQPGAQAGARPGGQPGP